MAYYKRQNFCEEDKMSYLSEQSSYGRTGGGLMRPHHNNNHMQMQMTECDSYTTTGYGAQGGYGAQSAYGTHGGYGTQGTYGAQSAYGAQGGYGAQSGSCFERKEEMCMSNTEFSGGRRHHKMNPFGHRRKRVVKYCEIRGTYSSSESDSD